MIYEAFLIFTANSQLNMLIYINEMIEYININMINIINDTFDSVIATLVK